MIDFILQLIYKKRLDRLWYHLNLLSELTQRPLAIPPQRRYATDCPVASYAPTFDWEGYFETWATGEGIVSYANKDYANEDYANEDCRKESKIKEYKIYDKSDSNWWHKLPIFVKRFIHRWVQKRIKQEYGI